MGSSATPDPLRAYIGMREAAAEALLGMGADCAGLQRYEPALGTSPRSSASGTSSGSRSRLPAASRTVCTWRPDLGKSEQANASCREALALLDRSLHREQMAATLAQLGTLYQEQGKNDQAQTTLTDALDLYQKLDKKQGAAVCQCRLGAVLENQGQFDRAEASYREAVKLFERFNAEAPDPSHLGALQYPVEDRFYARYARLLVRKQQPGAALAVADSGRGQGLARQALFSSVDFSRFVRPEEARTLAARLAEVARSGRRLRHFDTQARPKDAAGQKAFDGDRERASQAYRQTDLQLAQYQSLLYARHVEYARLLGRRPPSAADLALLVHRHPDTLFLEWAVVDEKETLLFAVTAAREAPLAWMLPVGAADLERRVRGWRRAAVGSVEPPVATGSAGTLQELPEPQQADSLYQLLLGPVEEAGLLAPGRFARLVLIPDGPLLDLPFAALRDRKTGRRDSQHSG